ncbi:MAG: UvrD-helicase domain-containing protein, partial [Clostridia bacterium]|nr:UvrD-helicase domain-containing protein [Clostridia bacterium]
NDLEHIALRLLKQGSVQKQIREKYAYVFVDEYQDVNPVQEELLNLLSGDNVFLVGDIKQAIYAFRGSKSEYFARKEKLFEKDEKANALLLTKNFRSASGILKAVNEEFSSVMTPSVCEVDYATSSMMDGGDRYASNDGRVHIHFLEKAPKTKEKIRRGVYSVEQSYLKTRAEISAYGEKMKQIVLRERNSEWYDADDGKKKRVEYSDIAVLSRKKSGGVDKIVTALSEAGIPVSASAETNVFDYPEIKTLVDILSLIDNAEQDIPLCSALLSAMGDLTATELAKIRIAYPSAGAYRECCKKYAEEKTDGIALKLKAFFELYNRFRTLSAVMDAGEILTKILSETKMEARLLSRDNGAGCLKRIHYFISQTAQSEQLSVHEFLDLLRSLDYRMPYSESGGENAVKIMTMHASKGLEYPVVILDDLSRTFKGEEDRFLHFDEQFGLATKCYDKSTMTQSNTLLWRLCKERENAEEVKNELNLFYVATTRAKYALHMVYGESAVACDVKYARSYADFTDFTKWEKYIEKDPTPILEKAERSAFVVKTEVGEADEIKAELLRKYPYESLGNLPVKTSASARMKAERSEEYYAVPVRFDENEEEKGQTDAVYGLAYHAFLENFDFFAYKNVAVEERGEFIENTLKSWKESGRLQAEYFNRLKVEKLLEILSLPVFEEVAFRRLLKEQEFLAELPVSDVYQGDKRYQSVQDERVLLQGAIDLLALSDEDALIVDYKYSVGGKEYLKEKYAQQLALYKKVVCKILKLPEERVKAKIVNIFKGFEVET